MNEWETQDGNVVQTRGNWLKLPNVSNENVLMNDREGGQHTLPVIRQMYLKTLPVSHSFIYRSIIYKVRVQWRGAQFSWCYLKQLMMLENKARKTKMFGGKWSDICWWKDDYRRHNSLTSLIQREFILTTASLWISPPSLILSKIITRWRMIINVLY